MSILGSDLLGSAKKIFESAEACEVDFRNAISRAYYGMYHMALESLQNVPNFSGNHHSSLFGYMSNTAETKSEPFDSHKLKLLAYKLKQQRNARNDADYRIKDIMVSKEVCFATLEAADAFFGEWSQISTAMKPLVNQQD